MAKAKDIVPPFVRNPYNYDTNAASDESGLKCEDKSLTQQQFAEESDINYIADRYGLTGQLPQVLTLPEYADYNGIFDFQSAQNAVINAKQEFLTLPAKIRSRFDNNPQRLLEFLANPENREEAEFLGLTTKKETTDASSRTEAPDGRTQAPAQPAGAPKNKGENAPDQKSGQGTPQADR